MSSTWLHLWNYAMYPMTSTRCGISAKQPEHSVGVSYPTAWRMLNKVRNEVMTDNGEPRLNVAQVRSMIREGHGFITVSPQPTKPPRYGQMTAATRDARSRRSARPQTPSRTTISTTCTSAGSSDLLHHERLNVRERLTHVGSSLSASGCGVLQARPRLRPLGTG